MEEECNPSGWDSMAVRILGGAVVGVTKMSMMELSFGVDELEILFVEILEA